MLPIKQELQGGQGVPNCEADRWMDGWIYRQMDGWTDAVDGNNPSAGKAAG